MPTLPKKIRQNVPCFRQSGIRQNGIRQKGHLLPFSSHLGRFGLCVFECTRTIGSLPDVHVSLVRFYSRAVWSLIETGRQLARFENPSANLLRSCIQGYQYLETLVLVLSKFGIGIDEYMASSIGIDQYLIAYSGINQNTNNSPKIKGIVYHDLN